MPMKCGLTTQTDDAYDDAAKRGVIPEAELRTDAKISAMLKDIREDPVLRMALMMNPDPKTLNEQHLFASWVTRKLGYGADPRGNSVLSEQDVNWLYAEMVRAKKTFETGQKWADATGMRAFMYKMAFLPQDIFRKAIVGGEDYFMETQTLRSDYERIRMGAFVSLNQIMDRLTSISKVSRMAITSALEPAERNIGIARQDLAELRESGVTDPTAIRDAEMRVTAAEEAYKRLLKGEHKNEAVGKAIRLERLIGNILDGSYTKMNELLQTEERHPFKVHEVKVGERMVDSGLVGKDGKPLPDMPEWIYERQIDRKQLEAVIRAEIGTEVESAEIKGIVDDVAGFLEKNAKLVRKAFKAQRENMVHSLMRGERRMTRDEAFDLVNRFIQLTMRDLYFPRLSNEAMARFERVSMQTDSVRDMRTVLEQAIADPKSFAFEGEGSPHTMERQFGAPSSDVSYNMAKVLSRYSQKIADYYHNNQLELISNRFLERLWTTSRAIKTDGERADFEKYVGAITEYIADFVDRSKNTPQAGKLYNVMKTLAAWKAGLTMGMLNPSTPLVNLAEGQLLIFTRAGRYYFHDQQKKTIWQQMNRELGIGNEYTDITENDLLGFSNEGIGSRRLPTNLSKEQRELYGMVLLDHSTLWTDRLSRLTSNIAKKTLILQRKAENANRSRAFKSGSIMEYEFLQHHRASFLDSEANARRFLEHGDYSDFEITKDSLSTKAGREKIWQKIVKERVVKAGFEMVFQTQWNYNQVARHYLERQPVGKILMMYQHYPLSWLSALRKNFEVLDSLRAAGAFDGGGVRGSAKAMIAPTSRDVTMGTSLGLPINQEAMFALSAGIIGLTLGAIRYNSGVVLGQLWQHPAAEAAEDMVKYVKYGFEGKFEQRKTLFWGRGMVNNFTGPVYSDLMDAISLAALKTGIDDGDMPRFAADVLRGTVGFRPNDLLLTEYGMRKFSNAWDVMYETFGLGAMSVAPKAARFARSIPGLSPGADMKDFSYALVRAAGVRDERMMNESIKRKIDREGKM